MQTTYSPFFWPTTSEPDTLISCGMILTINLENFIQATQELGISINDQATGNAFGGYFCPHNMDPKNWTRFSAEEAYYASAEPRPNYHLLTGHLVSRILTERCNETNTVKVTGVEFSTSADAESQQTKIKREAILAAGTLHTPQLLQVSGIGEASLLESINVKTVVDLPAVGHNLHDHLSVAVVNIREQTLPYHEFNVTDFTQ
jgi:choline dehydrogenase-like flavoprotein